MKIFNIMKCQSIIDGHIIPTGAIYGKLDLKYTEKIFTGKVCPVYDKNGYPLFHKNGVQITRRVYRRVEKSATVLYSVEDLFPVSIEKTTCFKAWYKINNGSWHQETPLNRNALTVELNNFIVRKLREYCAQNKTNLYNLCMNVKPAHINRHTEHKIAVAAAHRREVQREYMYHSRSLFGAKNVMDNGVRMDKPMGKSVIATHKGAFNGLHGETPTIVSADITRKSFKMSGKDSGFRASVETPCGIIRFYNEQEYNAHIQAAH